MHEGDAEARDRAWVEAVLAGDGQAFTELYREYAPAIRTVAAATVRDPETVDDVVQETFAKALRRLDSLQRPESLRPWLYSIARRCATDVVRERRLEAPAEGDAGLPDRATAALGPEQLAELGELASVVDGAVVGLSTRDAVAVVMMTGLGFPSADVAEVLGITRGAAKVAAHRARHRFRQALVLQMLVRARGNDCPELGGLLAAGDLVAAARHADACPACRTRAEAEIALYELEPDDPDAVLAKRVDERAGHGARAPLDQPEA